MKMLGGREKNKQRNEKIFREFFSLRLLIEHKTNAYLEAISIYCQKIIPNYLSKSDLHLICFA